MCDNEVLAQDFEYLYFYSPCKLFVVVGIYTIGHTDSFVFDVVQKPIVNEVIENYSRYGTILV